MKASEIKALAQQEANLHKTKKVLKTRSNGEVFAEYDYVPVKKVHITVAQNGGMGAFPDLNDEDLEKLKDYCLEKNLSLHEFEHEVEAESKAESKRKKSNED